MSIAEVSVDEEVHLRVDFIVDFKDHLVSSTLYKIIQCIQKDSPDFEFHVNKLRDSEIDPGTFEIYSDGTLIY